MSMTSKATKLDGVSTGCDSLQGHYNDRGVLGEQLWSIEPKFHSHICPKLRSQCQTQLSLILFWGCLQASMLPRSPWASLSFPGFLITSFNVFPSHSSGQGDQFIGLVSGLQKHPHCPVVRSLCCCTCPSHHHLSLPL